MRHIAHHVVAALGLTLAACGGHAAKPAAPAPAEDTTGGGGGGAQLANPASTYCVEVGGTLEIVDEEGGQVGYCTKGEQRCEEWKLFRGECPELAPGKPPTE